jgi:hypothetical protein
MKLTIDIFKAIRGFGTTQFALLQIGNRSLIGFLKNNHFMEIDILFFKFLIFGTKNWLVPNNCCSHRTSQQ